MTPSGGRPLPLGRCWAPVTLETFIEAEVMNLEDELAFMASDNLSW